ncbi:hypothetical protein ABFX02_08G229400 [Erythranthe guttata]
MKYSSGKPPTWKKKGHSNNNRRASAPKKLLEGTSSPPPLPPPPPPPPPPPQTKEEDCTEKSSTVSNEWSPLDDGIYPFPSMSNSDHEMVRKFFNDTIELVLYTAKSRNNAAALMDLGNI